VGPAEPAQEQAVCVRLPWKARRCSAPPTALNDKALASLKAKGMQVNEITAAEQKRMFDKVKPVYDKNVPTIGAEAVTQGLGCTQESARRLNALLAVMSMTVSSEAACPLAKPLPRKRSCALASKAHAREVRLRRSEHAGDAPDKATALVALLRLAGLPARLHYYLLRGEILRGITSTLASAARPVAEIWLDGHWVCTDTYIFDATYVAAARQRLKDAGWDWGYGIHTKAHTLWNGKDDAYLGGVAPDKDEMVISDFGVFDEPQAYVNSATYQNNHTRLTRAVHWNMLAPTMDKVARELRDDFGPSAAGSKKPS
jgi:hypothetical protein